MPIGSYIPRCKTCTKPLGEMRKDQAQLLICLADHSSDLREKYERQGWEIPETPIPTHRLFDRCLLNGPASQDESEVTCEACRGWEYIPIEHIPFMPGTNRRPPEELNQRIEKNLRNRIRRQSKVCCVQNSQSISTLCGKPLGKARQLVKADSFALVTCPECWEHRPKVIREAEAKLLKTGG